MRRNGKISVLSKNTRDELNERLDDGRQGKELVKWLNSLPEVQRLVRGQFRGKPISEQNLSQWKKGGYLEWQAKEERRFMAHQLREEAEEMNWVADPEEMQRHLSVMLTLELACAVREIKENTPDLKERLEKLEPLIGKFVQLRREESNARRVEMQWKLHKRELGPDTGGFGPIGALERLESAEDEMESQASAPAEASGNGEKSRKESSVSAGAKKKSAKKRGPSESESRPAGKMGSSVTKANAGGQSSGEGREAEAGQVAQGSSSQTGAGGAAETSPSNPGESKQIKVDQSNPVSDGDGGESKGPGGGQSFEP
jgi:hypothetical protein